MLTLFQNLGYQQITSLSASTALTVPARTPAGAVTRCRICNIKVESQAVRWRDDGVAPTAGVGMPLSVGDTLIYDGEIASLRFIEQVAGAKLNVSYYT
jgi:hypothetical protein